ncbi:MAG TPA: BTAD domain-containing putative transcriptional regulator [Micromonosporaceae bacterium]|jgi:DNA-binding SARP family transcriptional activator/tetratricopeptide (TPR) repeat protein
MVKAVLLGRFGLLTEDGPCPIPRARTRALVALLALHAGRPVSQDAIVQALWGEAAPPSARGQVHSAVSAVRRLLQSAGAPPVLLADRFGYILAVQPSDVDVHVFEQATRLARDAAAAGRGVEAGRLLRAALSGWGVEPLADVAGAFVEGARARLVDRYTSAWEQLADIQLATARVDGLADELAQVVEAHPLREPLRLRYMRALVHEGRQTEALQTYRSYRGLLAEREGLDPGREIRDLESVILRGIDTGPVPQRLVMLSTTAEADGPVPDRPIPAQLPPAVADFTARCEELAQLDRLVDGALDATHLVVVAGTAGVGKTALVVHWAHRVRDRFPDGQLFLDLRGFGPGAELEPSEALSYLLGALGLASERVPTSVSEASALYRSLLVGRRMLVVLDNAASEEQVRPLLPAGNGTLVLVTSRASLVGLAARNGARSIALAPFSAAESGQLLSQVLGDQRVAAEAEAVRELAAACGHLPLALRIAAAHLSIHPAWSTADYVNVLTRGGRLAGLSVPGDPEASLETALNASYARLPEQTRRMFRLLAVVPGPEVTADAVAALAGVDEQSAAAHLSQLAAAHLVDERQPGRYSQHDLLKEYACDRLATHETEDRRCAAARRLFTFYLGRAWSASRRLYPLMALAPAAAGRAEAFPDRAEARAWVSRELPNLYAVALRAEQHGAPEIAWQMADALRPHLWAGRQSVASWLAVVNAGLTCADRSGRPDAQAPAYLGSGTAHLAMGRLGRAVAHLRHAVALSRQAGWSVGERSALNNLAVVRFDQGDLAAAARHYTSAIALARQAEDAPSLAVFLVGLGKTVHLLGAAGRALDLFTEARALAHAHLSSGTEAAALCGLGEIYAETGDRSAAIECVEASLALVAGADDPLLAAVHNAAGSVRRACGQPDLAIHHHRRALRMSAAGVGAYLQCEALLGLCDTYRALHRPRQAVRYARRAAAIAQQIGYRVLDGLAAAALSAALLDAGDRIASAAAARRAAEVHRAAGCRLAYARDLMLLGRLGDGPEPAGHFRTALGIFTEVGVVREADRARRELAA